MTKESEGAQFVRYFGPLLDALRHLGESGTPAEVRDQIASDLRLGEETLDDLLDSGTSRFANQVAWARFYLAKEGLITSSKRGVWTLSETGRDRTLSYDEAHAIFLKWVKIFAEERRAKAAAGASAPDVDDDTTAEASETQDSEGIPTDEVLEVIRSLSAGGFERLCQRLLRESGFAQVTLTGGSGDEGIDGFGILRVNPLVSFKIYFQCKRYKDSVSPRHVRDFRGAMQGRADKGLILTTGSFSSGARKEAVRDGAPPIELIDGVGLVEMLKGLELGLLPRTVYEVDHGFFREYRD